MSNDKVKRLAKLLAQDLFTTGGDGKKVDTLRMYRGEGPREIYLGGWSEEGAVSRIEKILMDELRDFD